VVRFSGRKTGQNEKPVSKSGRFSGGKPVKFLTGTKVSINNILGAQHMSFELPDLFKDALSDAVKEHGKDVLDAVDKLARTAQSAADALAAVSDNIEDLIEQYGEQAPVDETVVTREVKIEYILSVAKPDGIYAKRWFLDSLADDVLDFVFASFKQNNG
jgi:hypothetical protein